MARDAGLRVAPGVQFIIQCGSEAVEKFIREHGFYETFLAAGARGPLILLPLLALPLAPPLVRTLAARHEDGPAMNAALAGTARLALIYCVLLAVGLAA